MNWYKKASLFICAETTSIYDLIDEEDVPSNEVLYDFINRGELHTQLPIKTIDDPKSLMTHKGDMSVWESYQFANDQSKELIQSYTRKPINDIIVINETRVLDGNHRVVGSILGKWQLKAIDLSDLPNEEEEESEE